MPLLSIFISLFVIFPFNEICRGNSHSAFDKNHFYSVFASSDLNSINTELNVLSAHSSESAYEGALQMKKASIINNPKDKLALFKQGRTKLESAIKNSSDNAEYRFLRLMIQENAPGFLGYNSNLQEDKKIIVTYYKSLETPVQQAIKNYSKTSKLLTPNLF